MAERRTVDPNVAGSSPAGGILLLLVGKKIFKSYFFLQFKISIKFIYHGCKKRSIYAGISIIKFTLVLKSCPGGVGAIMRACRARDSGSNPGQGVVGP